MSRLRIAPFLALVAVLVGQPLSAGDPPVSVILSIGPQEPVFAEVGTDWPTTIQFAIVLKNRGKKAVLVEPVIGGTCGSLRVLARPVGIEGSRWESIFSQHSFFGCGLSRDDLFSLKPGRALRRPMVGHFRTALLTRAVKALEFVAEFDTGSMRHRSPEALEGQFKSEPAIASLWWPEIDEKQ